MLLSTRKIKIKSITKDSKPIGSDASLLGRQKGIYKDPNGDPIRYLAGIVDHFVQLSLREELADRVPALQLDNPYSSDPGIQLSDSGVRARTFRITPEARSRLRIPFSEIVIHDPGPEAPSMPSPLDDLTVPEADGVERPADLRIFDRPRLQFKLDFKFEDDLSMYVLYNEQTLREFFGTGERGEAFSSAIADSHLIFGGASPDLTDAAQRKRYYLFLHYKVLETLNDALKITAMDSILKNKIQNDPDGAPSPPLDAYFDHKVRTDIANTFMGNYDQVGLEMLAPIAESELTTADNNLSSMQFLSNENYNFFVKEYEKEPLSPANPSNQNLPEYFLPSSLTLNFINELNNTISDLLTDQRTTVDDVLPYEILRRQLAISLQLDSEYEIFHPSQVEIDPESLLTKEYFKKFGRVLQRLQAQGGIVADNLQDFYKRRFKNIFIDTNINNRYNNKHKFPLYNEITLIDDNYLNNLSISNNLLLNNNYKKRNTLFNLFSISNLDLEEEFLSPLAPRETILTRLDARHLENSLTDQGLNEFSSKKIKRIPLDYFFSEASIFYNTTGTPPSEKTPEQFVKFASRRQFIVDNSLNIPPRFSRAATEADLAAELELIDRVYTGQINNKITSLNDAKSFLLNEKEYFEIFAYKIVKTNLATNVKQNFFVLNTNDEIIKFTDSQIKYNQEYSYEVFAYLLSFYDSYHYAPTSEVEDFIEAPLDSITPHEVDGWYNTFSTYVTAAKIPCVFEIPFVEERSLNVDSPPLAPNVDFFVKKDVNNRVHFLLSQKTGNSIEDPVIVTGDDRQKFNKNARQQKRQDGKIFFKTDEPAYSYEIFRLTEMPKSLKDFDGSKIEVVSTIAGQQTEVKEFFDTIQMNQDYYYLFRVVDNHENISNPTNVFKFNLVNKNGLINPTLETIPLSEIQPNQIYKKDLRSFLKISPSFLQKRMPVEQFENKSSNQLTEVYFEDLGEASVISNPNSSTKFLIEIKSKKTGKINFIELKYETDFSKFIS